VAPNFRGNLRGRKIWGARINIPGGGAEFFTERISLGGRELFSEEHRGFPPRGGEFSLRGGPARRSGYRRERDSLGFLRAPGVQKGGYMGDGPERDISVSPTGESLWRHVEAPPI